MPAIKKPVLPLKKGKIKIKKIPSRIIRKKVFMA